ncbi:hypothetical protein BOC45_15180 [Burkholderia pseudomallei]|nr:hypothetical protein BOC45_15180 [Burkholderia pseudomallei]
MLLAADGSHGPHAPPGAARARHARVSEAAARDGASAARLARQGKNRFARIILGRLKPWLTLLKTSASSNAV